MKLSTTILLSLPLFHLGYTSSECDQELKSIFDGMASSVNDGTGLFAAIPAACEDEKRNILTENDGFLDYKTNYNTYCTSDRLSFNTSVVTYSYDLNIAVANATRTGLDMALFGDPLLAGSSDPHNCNSGLTYIPNGENGWTIWVEEFDTTSSTCSPPTPLVDIMDLQSIALINLVVEKKTSFCITLEGGSNWRGVVRGLYSNETRFESVADIPCYSSNPGFPVVTNCFANITSSAL